MKATGTTFIVIILSLLFSCRKESFITSPDAAVHISADTLKYDTVFVTTGSTYRSFKILNENNRKLHLSSVKLMGGSSSVYKMNVDGVTGHEFSGIEIEANDSLYVFVQVNVDPSAAALPFILRDSIQVSYNGIDKWVQLEAWGQNAHFLRDKVISTDETWNNDLPYVILGSLYVEPDATLTINKGSRIYVHADAPVIIDGSLQVNGLKDTADRVYFQGDRMDAPYSNFPASWPGIYFRPSSKNNILTYVVIKNAYEAIAAEGPAPGADPKLILNQVIIDNAYAAGIIAVNSSIEATNCLITNCGKNLYLIKGGDYSFSHCTVATYANRYIDHKDPVLTVTNFANNEVADLTASFTNCIFWGENGTVDNEVQVLKTGNSVFNVTFDHNLWKVQVVPANISSAGIIANQSPVFDSINTSDNYYDFRLKTDSPAIDAGTGLPVTIDLDGHPRPVSLPDLGCFEKQ